MVFEVFYFILKQCHCNERCFSCAKDSMAKGCGFRSARYQGSRGWGTLLPPGGKIDFLLPVELCVARNAFKHTRDSERKTRIDRALSFLTEIINSRFGFGNRWLLEIERRWPIWRFLVIVFDRSPLLWLGRRFASELIRLCFLVIIIVN